MRQGRVDGGFGHVDVYIKNTSVSFISVFYLLSRTSAVASNHHLY